MINYKSNILEANRHFKTADHLVYMTFPLVNDNKLMITIIQNLLSANQMAIGAILEYEKTQKTVITLPQNFNSRFALFKTKYAKQYKVPEDVLKMIQELTETLEEHEQSPIEFARKDKFVICTEEYRKLKTVDIKLLKQYLTITRKLLAIVSKIQ